MHAHVHYQLYLLYIHYLHYTYIHANMHSVPWHYTTLRSLHYIHCIHTCTHTLHTNKHTGNDIQTYRYTYVRTYMHYIADIYVTYIYIYVYVICDIYIYIYMNTYRPCSHLVHASLVTWSIWFKHPDYTASLCLPHTVWASLPAARTAVLAGCCFREMPWP